MNARILLPAIVATLLCIGRLDAAGPPFLAQGELVGDVTSTTAIVRTRLTLHQKPNPGLAFSPTPRAASRPATQTASRPAALPLTQPMAPPVTRPVADLPEGLPGAPGRARILYSTKPDLAGANATDWQTVDASTDFSAQFSLQSLTPATIYYYRAECAAGPGADSLLGRIGSFVTAPPLDASAAVRFCVITGQAMRSRDIERPDGTRDFASYAAMAKLRPDFFVGTGDNVYYDNDGVPALDESLARYHWNRIFALPNVRELFGLTSAYFEKDDHDYRWNDCWPAEPVPNRQGMMITDELGRRLFREAVPVGPSTYRSIRWGKGLEIWLLEGRDFRSPNTMPDSPEKTIWGQEEKQWLKQSLLASPCRYKLVISPTPIIGPDRGGKGDNHASTRPTGFHAEGQEFLTWIQQQKIAGLYIICGDRHWQYHSFDSRTGIQEFSSGPISDLHAQRGPGQDPAWHKYYSETGGFLSVSVEPDANDWRITFRHHRPDGSECYKAVNP